MLTSNQYSALMIAAECGFVELVELLAPLESRLLIKNTSAISLAASNNHL